MICWVSIRLDLVYFPIQSVLKSDTEVAQNTICFQPLWLIFFITFQQKLAEMRLGYCADVSGVSVMAFSCCAEF